MKANELNCKYLMVDDWVRIKITQHNTTVTNIDKNSVYTGAVFPIRYDEIEPIPLTTDILEKNGFVKCSYVGGFYSHWCPFRIYIAEGVGFSFLFDDEIHFTCTYIHQLKHALRLCEIDKEIIL